MQDVRIRTGAAALLSVAAFISVQGAAAAFIWWLVFTENFRILTKTRLILSSIVLIGFFCIVLELTTGGGISYFFRMIVVIILGAWLFHEQQQGDFLNFGQWLLGDRIGFEMGMIAEMAMQSLDTLVDDFNRIQNAEYLKGTRWGIRSIVPAGLILVHRTLARAEETAEMLAVRGYTFGGTRCPVFSHSRRDFIAGFFAICAAIIAMIPVSAFFILS
jgi:energy-coupling factor transporter transmembrane protein EcfT